MKDKIILDLCGGTGSWSKPYRDAGYDVRLVTLPDIDVRTYVAPESAYGVLAAPPCTIFSRANWKVKKNQRDFKEAMECVRACMEIIWGLQERTGAGLAFWALENPQGYLYNFLGQPAFHFQPWQFGEVGPLMTKRTAIWGYFNEPLRTVSERTFEFIDKYTRNKQERPATLFPVERKINDRWSGMSAKKRSITPAGFAEAFFKANP